MVERAVALLEVDPARLDDDAPFAGLGVDSLALVEYALALEDVFDVELPEEVVAALVTVGDLVDAVLLQRSAGLEP